MILLTLVQVLATQDGPLHLSAVFLPSAAFCCWYQFSARPSDLACLAAAWQSAADHFSATSSFAKEGDEVITATKLCLRKHPFELVALPTPADASQSVMCPITALLAKLLSSEQHLSLDWVQQGNKLQPAAIADQHGVSTSHQASPSLIDKMCSILILLKLALLSNFVPCWGPASSVEAVLHDVLVQKCLDLEQLVQQRMHSGTEGAACLVTASSLLTDAAKSLVQDLMLLQVQLKLSSRPNQSWSCSRATVCWTLQLLFLSLQPHVHTTQVLQQGDATAATCIYLKPTAKHRLACMLIPNGSLAALQRYFDAFCGTLQMVWTWSESSFSVAFRWHWCH